MSNKNINTNTAIANIILSDKHEIRLKKKKKKSSSGAKKKALEDVKSALKNYDLAVAEAKSKNISLPAELGELPVKIEDVNSVKELQQLAIKLNNMTAQINTLIAQGASQQRTIGLFQEGMIGQRQGVLPTIIQPQIIQPQVPQQPVPQPQPQPQPPQDDSAEKTLDEIRQEILDKLSEEDRAKAEEEINKQPVSPDEPVAPEPSSPINPSDLETNLNVEFGTQTIPKLVSPVGFYDIFADYRRYIKDVVFRTKKIIEGQYRISKDDQTILEQERIRILDKYDTWQSGLNKQQLAYVDSDPQLLMVYNEMLKELNLDVSELAENILQQQGEKLESFEVGDTPVPIEEKAEKRLSVDGEKYKTQISQIRTYIEQYRTFKTNNPDELKQIIDDLNSLKIKIDKYDKLEAIDKVGLEVLHGQVVDEYNNAQKEAQDKLLKVQQEQGFSPPQPKSPETQLEEDIQLLNNYSRNIRTKYSKNVLNALKRIPNSEITVESVIAIRSRKFDTQNIGNDTKKIISEFLDQLPQTKKENKPKKKLRIVERGVAAPIE